MIIGAADDADMINDPFPYKDLTYKIRGILFKIQNDLGTKFQEKHFHKAVAVQLSLNNLYFEQEVPVTISYEGIKLGTLRLDFIVERINGLELKTVDRLTSEHLKQVLRYSESLQLPIILIVNFRIRPLQIIRVINSKYL